MALLLWIPSKQQNERLTQAEYSRYLDWMLFARLKASSSQQPAKYAVTVEFTSLSNAYRASHAQGPHADHREGDAN